MTAFTLHIFLSSIESETRLYKEAAFTLKTGICVRVAVLGLWREGLAMQETTAYGLEIRRLQTIVRRYRNSALLRRLGVLRKVFALLSLIQYAFACIMTARQLRPDHISCHNAIMLPVAWAAARWSGATLEYLPHELETQRSGLMGMAKRVTAFVERRFIGSARNVVVVCEPIQEWYKNAYGLANVHVVRNVPERDAVQVRPLPEGGFRERFGIPDSAKVFIYQGLFSMGRGIETLLETFSKLDPAHSHLVLMGYGDDRYQAMVDDAAASRANVHFQPAVAREWIVSYSASADVGIFISERASLSYRYALPNKFFEWAHAGLPILVSENLEYQASLLQENGFGWAAPFDCLIRAVKRVSDTDLAPFARNASRYAASAIWDEEAKVFTQVYRSKNR